MQGTATDSEKPVGIAAASLPDAQKTAEPSRIEQLRPHEFPRAKEPVPASVEKPKLSDGHMAKKSLSILNYVRGPLPKDIPVPLSHSMNGKNKPWEPFIAEEFAHQFHESVLQSTQKALQKHKGNGNKGSQSCKPQFSCLLNTTSVNANPSVRQANYIRDMQSCTEKLAQLICECKFQLQCPAKLPSELWFNQFLCAAKSLSYTVCCVLTLQPPGSQHTERTLKWDDLHSCISGGDGWCIYISPFFLPYTFTKTIEAECVQILTHGKDLQSRFSLSCCVQLLGHAMTHSAEQNHKVDASIHYNIPELQTSSWVSLPQQNGQKDSQHKGFIPPEHDTVSDSEEDEEEEEEEYPRPKWHGIEAIFEAYQEYIEGKLH